MESRNCKIIGTIVAACLMFAACSETNKKPYCLSEGDKALLSTGDIIMRRGEGVLSTIIVNCISDTLNLSHCGIVVREGDSINVIHCLSSEVSDVNGAQKCSLDEFTTESVPGTIAAVRCIKDTIGCLAEGAVYYLNTRKPFDLKFDIKDTTEFYCSEMPLRILKDKLGLNLIPNEGHTSFSLFFNPEYFDVLFKNK